MPTKEQKLPLFDMKEGDDNEIGILERLNQLKALIPPGKPSTRINARLASIVKRLRLDGYYNHQIASMIGCNQGRIAEINRGHTFFEVPPA